MSNQHSSQQHTRRQTAIEATALKDLIARYDAIEAKINELRHDADGNELETLSPEAEAELSALQDEVVEVRSGIVAETDRVKAVREVAEARRQANLASHAGTASAAVSVESEPMVYGCDGDKYQAEHSHWADRFTVEGRGVSDPNYAEAAARLALWGHQCEREIALKTPFGKHAEAELREHFRRDSPEYTIQALNAVRERGRVALQDKAELRATGTGAGPTVSATSGASSFITPVFVGPYVVYREYGRAFADQCEKPPMPAYGMGIYKPQVTGGAGVAAYTELGTVTELDPTAGYLAGALGIYSGQVVLSQAVLDRTAPDFRYDLMVQDQIARKEAPILDAYVIGKAITNGATAIAYTATFAVASTSGVTSSLYGHVSQAKATTRKAAGAVLNPTHVWLDPVRWEVVAGWGDSQGRPVVVPDYANPFNAVAAGSPDGDAGIEGYTGYRFNGLKAFTDPSLPTTGGTANLDQVLVTVQNEIEYYEGSPVDRILPQTLASNLETIIQRYRYVTVIENYAAATQPIQGAAFAAPSWGS